MRWQAHFYLTNGNESRTNNTNTYGLKSKHAAPPVSDLKPFEDDVAKMIESVKFRNTSDNFIKTLERDKRKISDSNNVFVPADKTRDEHPRIQQIAN